MAKELDVKFESPAINELAEQLAARLGPGDRAKNIFNKHMLASIKQAMKPGVKLLKNETPRGPTGNLRRAVAQIARNYRKDRKWFGAVGYSASGQKSKIHKHGYRTGRNLGYHQGLVEFGTKDRKVPQRLGLYTWPIASAVGRFKDMKVRKKRDGSMYTSPKPPKGFFRAGVQGRDLVLPSMRPQKNIPKVYGIADDFMESALRRDTQTRVEKAWKNLDYIVKNNK